MIGMARARDGVLGGVLGLVLAACASSQAAVPAGPPLVVPAPPARVLSPVEAPAAVETPPPPVPVAEAPVPAPDPAEPASAPPRPAVAVTPAPEPPAPVRDLRAGPAAGETEAMAALRTTLRRAARDLAGVDYNALNGARRLQYEQSRRFSQQAEAAIRDRNLVFAATLADKAAALAAELAGP